MDIRSRQGATSYFSPPFFLLLLLVCAYGEACRADVSEPDYFLRETGDDDATLIVFVAGLGGKQTWDRMTELMRADPGFERFDYLLYYSPSESTIEENTRRLSTILSERLDAYEEAVYVGHSIGGMIIKNALLAELSAHPEAPRLPESMITFGTPLNLDKFSVSTFKQLGARIAWRFISPLRKEVFKLERLKEINAGWRTAAATAPIGDLRAVYIFGTEDETAPARGEGGSGQTVFISGDHSGIVSPASADACSWIVFRAALLEPDSDVRSLDCILPASHLNGTPVQ